MNREKWNVRGSGTYLNEYMNRVYFIRWVRSEYIITPGKIKIRSEPYAIEHREEYPDLETYTKAFFDGPNFDTSDEEAT